MLSNLERPSGGSHHCRPTAPPGTDNRNHSRRPVALTSILTSPTQEIQARRGWTQSWMGPKEKAIGDRGQFPLETGDLSLKEAECISFLSWSVSRT